MISYLKTTATNVRKIKAKKIHNSIYKKGGEEERKMNNYELWTLILFYNNAKFMSSTQ